MKRIVKPSTDITPFQISKKELLIEAAFGPQAAFVNDISQFIAAQCSRRSGKTTGLALRFFRTMAKYPKCTCIYLALTRDSAKDILWPVLQELNEQYNLKCEFKESTLECHMPNGSKLKLYGADMPNFIRRLKGQKSPGIAIDEAQDFGMHLQSLINDVLTPLLTDYGGDGWLAITGTPGPVPQGYFFEVTHEGKYGYSVHKWTLLDNPHIPDPVRFIESLIRRNEWEENNPTLLREWRNQWVLDVDSLWVRYKEEKCHYAELPQQVKKWQYVLGIDIGFRDADALAVVAWSDEVKETYLVEELVTKKQDITSLIEQINEISKRYNFQKIVIDQGGLGLKIAEEMRRRHGISIDPADKKLKAQNVGYLNDDLRLGRFKAHAKSRFALDSYLVQIDWDKSTPDKIVIKKEPHSDIIDAVLYAYKETYAYTHEPEPDKKPKWGSKEWADQQHDSMFEAELEGLQAEQAFKTEYGDY